MPTKTPPCDYRCDHCRRPDGDKLEASSVFACNRGSSDEHSNSCECLDYGVKNSHVLGFLLVQTAKSIYWPSRLDQ